MIARVFPTKTNLCPEDEHSYFSSPDMFTPNYDEIHVSCQFTWDIDRAYELAETWKSKGNVKVGGVAINGESKEPFKAGIYLKKGVTITSRGCPNNCSFCLIKNNLIELNEFPEGNIIQDNNFLACSDQHRERVYSMLKKQSGIEFKGGLEAARVTPKIADELRSLRVKSLWLACDHDSAIKPLRRAVEILLNAGFKKSHLYCYVLIGKEEMRLREVFDIGCMPFAQLYQPPERKKIEYSPQSKVFQRTWCRPAAYKSFLKDSAGVKDR